MELFQAPMREEVSLALLAFGRKPLMHCATSEMLEGDIVFGGKASQILGGKVA